MVRKGHLVAVFSVSDELSEKHFDEMNQSINQSIKVNYKATSLDQPGGGPANKVKALIS